jgi:hypothetical protein
MVLLSAASNAAALVTPTFTQQASVSGASGAFFGYAVAVDGDTAVVGAIDDNATKGAAYVYVRSGTAWTLQQTLQASDGAALDEFGYSVALSGDRLLVGAAGKASGQGYVYAFARTGSTWSQLGEFTSGDGATDDGFGTALAVRGTAALVGASGKALRTGVTYFFNFQNGSWVQGSELAGESIGDSYGFSTAISQDGSTAIVGAYGANNETGKAYVYAASGSTWTQQATLTARLGAAHDRFGYSVAVDGNLALVGAYGRGGNLGTVYPFERSGTAWIQDGPGLVAQDGAANDFFGWSVALSGNEAVIGAYEKAGTFGPGAVYGLTLSGGQWFQQKIVAPSAGQYFGYSVAMSGTTVGVGGFGAGNDSGSAFLFQLTAVPVPALGGGVLGASALALLLAAAGLSARRRSVVSRGDHGGVHAS